MLANTQLEKGTGVLIVAGCGILSMLCSLAVTYFDLDLPLLLEGLRVRRDTRAKEAFI